MFGYSHLPFSTSETTLFNGEIFSFTFNAGLTDSINLDLNSTVSFILNIERDRVVIL
jgi:hypothetical protein